MWWIGLGLCLLLGTAAGWMLAMRSIPIEVAKPEPAQPALPSEAERRLLRIVEALPLGVMVFDQSGKQLFANGAAASFADDRLHAALISSAITDVVAAASTQPDAAATRMLELYGSARTHISIRGVQLPESVVGQFAVVVTLEDATELRSADLLRRDFVANVSHELKTPIGAIGVLAETLIDVEDFAVARRLAERLQHEAFRLASTVDDLLTLARIESGEHAEMVPVRLDDVLASVAGRVSTQAEARGVELSIDVDPQDLTVVGDRFQLISGFGNLVDNAVKYSGEGEQVTVRCRRQDDRAMVMVQDEGIGIPEADLDRIFERFYRVDRGRSRDTGGTGLGLSIVRHVLLNHDGSVEVDSVEGEGTTFTVSIPAVGHSPRPDGQRTVADVG